MASAKPAAVTRRPSSNKRPRDTGASLEVSPARWAGVAFVITAIVAAIVLAMVSPSSSSSSSSPGEPGQPPPVAQGIGSAGASPAPSPTKLDQRVPVARPSITSPSGGRTREIDIEVVVALPEDELPKGKLTLHIMRGEEVLESVKGPKPGTSVTVKGVRIDQGVNELTAVLEGPGGPGPSSMPVLVEVDRSLTELSITSPQNKSETYDEKVLVEGMSVPGARVIILNTTNGAKADETVGNSGQFDASIRLKRGTMNVIEATSRDDAGLPQTDTIRVRRLDGKPRVAIKDIGAIKRAALPTNIRVVVDVTDDKGKPLEGADVELSLGAQDRSTLTGTEITNAQGRARWVERVEPSSSNSTADALELVVTVTHPLSGESRTETRTIPFS